MSDYEIKYCSCGHTCGAHDYGQGACGFIGYLPNEHRWGMCQCKQYAQAIAPPASGRGE